MEEAKGKWHGHTSSEVRTRYNAKAYDQVAVRLPKGQRDIIKAKADEAGQSMAEYICSALTAYGCPVTSKLTEGGTE